MTEPDGMAKSQPGKIPSLTEKIPSLTEIIPSWTEQDGIISGLTELPPVLSGSKMGPEMSPKWDPN